MAAVCLPTGSVLAQSPLVSSNQTSGASEVRIDLPGRTSDLGLDGGLLSGRLKFSNGRVDAPAPTGGGADALISRRDLLRMKDAHEEKQNWMFLEPGQLQRERTQKEEEGSLRSRWDLQEDFKRRSWLEYGIQKPNPGSQPGSLPELKSQSRYDSELRSRQLLDSKDGVSRFNRGSGATSITSRERDSAHQSGELNMSDLVGQRNPARFEDPPEEGLRGLFGGESLNPREREGIQNRKREFTEFLNQSRVGARPPGDPSGSALSEGASLRHPFGTVGRISARDGLPPLGGSELNRSTSLREAYDPNRGVDGTASIYSRPGAPGSVRSPETPRSFVTPEMMQGPKRRF